MEKTIFVTGGAGFIGSMVNLMLNDAGFKTIVYDNLSTGSSKAVIKGQLVVGDLADKKLLLETFKAHRIDAVMHFAALTDVGESTLNPSIYYQNNVTNTLTLLDAMRAADIRYFIFSSSAAVYGIPKTAEITEASPCCPINPYGETKWVVEKILRDYAAAYPFYFSSLRYFNAAGGDPSFRLKHYKKKENNLIPIVLKSLIEKKSITIFGTDYPTPDGTCIRDYIDVYDLGTAHLLALEKLLKDNLSTCYNLGNGNGFSVREVISAAELVTGQKVLVQEGARRMGDPPILLANADKALRELNWKPSFPKLTTMIEHAWKARN